MIDGIRLESDLQSKQVQFMLARLAFRQHILEQAMRAFYTFEKPKTEEEYANAAFSLDLSLKEADDPGRVLAFLKEHGGEILPTSMR